VPDPEPPAAPGYELVFVGVDAERCSPNWHGPPFLAGTRFALPLAKEILIGRMRSATICCFSNAVAPIHVRAILRDDTLHFEDAASTNGTWIDGQRVARGALAVGQRLALAGAFVFELRRAGP
jgi:pSer/pThr/pTyr-binding forkhead associated (FHA) protein